MWIGGSFEVFLSSVGYLLEMDPKILAQAYVLTEKDVPGALLRDRNPGTLTVPEQKRWLACRGASRRGRKPDLVMR